MNMDEKLIEVVHVGTPTDKQCTLEQLIETLNLLKEKYGDIEIIRSESYMTKIYEVGVCKKEDGTYYADITGFDVCGK